MSKKRKIKRVDSSEFFSMSGVKPVSKAKSTRVDSTELTDSKPADSEGGSFIDSTLNTAGDSALVALQSASLDWLDDAIAMVADEETANEFRAKVAKAKEDSPYATTIAEILTPDLIDLFTGGASMLATKIPKLAKLYKASKGTKLSKLIGSGDTIDKYKSGLSLGVDAAKKGSARAMATEAISQQGRGEDFNGGNIAGSGALGGILGGALGSIGNRNRLRASAIGLNDDVLSMSNKSKGVLGVDDYNSDTTKILEDMGIFGGNTKFDKGSLKFRGDGKRSNLVVPPSNREILSRANVAKDEIGNKINDLLSGNSEGMFDTGKASIDLSTYMEPLEEMALTQSITGKEANSLKNTIKDVMNDFSEKHGRTTVTPLEANTLKQDIYKRINFDRKSGNPEMTPDTERALKYLANQLKESVNEAVGDPEVARLNDMYGRLSDVSSSLDRKIAIKSGNNRIATGLGSPNPAVKAISAVNTVTDSAERVAGQLSETLNTPREVLGGGGIKGILDRGTRKAVPAFSRDQRDNPNMSVEPKVNPNRSFISPKDRLDFNITKELQKAKVPRNSEAIASNPNLLKYKLAQEAESIVMGKMANAGIDVASINPIDIQKSAEDYYKNAEMLLTDMKDEIPAALPMLVREAPQLFEKDPYQRIDDTVPESMKMNVQEAIRKSGGWNKGKSTHEMIAELDELNSTGKYYG